MRATILKGVSVYAPEPLGKKDVLIIGDKIAAIKNSIDEEEVKSLFGEANIFEGEDVIAVPGIIDQHVHINGAGGEGGAIFRTPPLPSSELLRSGITTVVGLLGTDGITRSLRDLLMKARSLREEGIEAYIYTGSYQYPPPTITGDVASDIMLINEVIGVKVAVSDHRSSNPGAKELIALASSARVAGILSGKAGVVHIHMGEGKRGFKPILDAVEQSDIPIEQFAPTHVNRSRKVLEESIEFAKAGGYLDVTSGVSLKSGFSRSVKPSEAISFLIKSGVSPSKITMSSDGNGSMPEFDERGELLKILVSPVSSLYEEFRDLVLREGLPIELASKIVSTNVAEHLKLSNVGKIDVGKKANILLLSKDGLKIEAVICAGKLYRGPGKEQTL